MEHLQNPVLAGHGGGHFRDMRHSLPLPSNDSSSPCCVHMAGLFGEQGHRAPVADMAVDASGGLLASGGADRAVRVWDTDGGYCTHVFSGHTRAAVSGLMAVCLPEL